MSILMSFSCSKKEVKEFGEYEEVSIGKMEMRVRGNCMPIELEGISVHSIIHVVDERITDLTFLTPNEIACITEEGKIFTIEVGSGSAIQIADFMIGIHDPWSIFAHNEGELIVMSPSRKDRTDIPEAYFLACLDINGELYWKNENLTFPTPLSQFGTLFNDGTDYYLIAIDDNYSIGMFRVMGNGEVVLAETDIGTGNLFGIYQGYNQFFWLNPWNGPYFSNRTSSGYSRMEPWNRRWTDGLDWPLLDGADRFVGFRIHNTIEHISYSLIILEKGEFLPAVVDYNQELNLDIAFYGCLWPTSPACSSNGEIIVIMTTHYLLKYFNGNLEIWHDNIDDYNDGYNAYEIILGDGSTPFISPMAVSEMLTDATCEHFLIRQLGSIMFGGDEIEIIDLGEKITSDIQFTPDFKRACLALEDGSIVVLDIEGTPVDQN
jgi:hypothetical protein